MLRSASTAHQAPDHERAEREQAEYGPSAAGDQYGEVVAEGGDYGEHGDCGEIDRVDPVVRGCVQQHQDGDRDEVEDLRYRIARMRG